MSANKVYGVQCGNKEEGLKNLYIYTCKKALDISLEKLEKVRVLMNKVASNKDRDTMMCVAAQNECDFLLRSIEKSADRVYTVAYKNAFDLSCYGDKFELVKEFLF